MTQLAVGYKNASNGRQQRSDGFNKHLGLTELAGLRLGTTPSGLAVSPINGRGLELGFHDNTKQGYLWCYDRDTGGFYDLSIQARSIAIFPQAPGTLQLPADSIDGSALVDGTVTSAEIQDGTIRTQDIAANAVQQLIGSFGGAPTFSTSAAGWIATPIAVQVTTSGGLLRVEAVAHFVGSANNVQFYAGPGINGTVQLGLGYYTLPLANTPCVPATIIWYCTLAAGTYTFSLMVYNVSAPTYTLSISNSVNSVLYVTEQKR